MLPKTTLPNCLLKYLLPRKKRRRQRKNARSVIQNASNGGTANSRVGEKGGSVCCRSERRKPVFSLIAATVFRTLLSVFCSTPLVHPAAFSCLRCAVILKNNSIRGVDTARLTLCDGEVVLFHHHAAHLTGKQHHYCDYHYPPHRWRSCLCPFFLLTTCYQLLTSNEHKRILHHEEFAFRLRGGNERNNLLRGGVLYEFFARASDAESEETV